jgi:hypothetical protein
MKALLDIGQGFFFNKTVPGSGICRQEAGKYSIKGGKRD